MSQQAKGQRVWTFRIELPGGSVRMVRIWAHGETSAANKARHRYRGARLTPIRTTEADQAGESISP